MSRLVLALIIAVGLCAPGAASAQVWKLKKAKTGTSAKTPAKKAKAKTARRPIKKKKRAASKPRKVDLVPDEAEATSEPVDDTRPAEPDEPIIIQVEEID